MFGIGGGWELVALGTLMFVSLSLIKVNINIFNEIEKETKNLNKKTTKGSRKEQKRVKERLEYLDSRNEFYSDLNFKVEFISKIVQNMINKLIEPYQNILDSIRTLKIQNWFYYIVLVILFYILITYVDDLLVHKNELLDRIMADEHKDISLGILLGIILYHSTPILFISSIFIYLINQINKNLRIIESLRIKREDIDLLESTLYTKIELGASDEEIIEDIKFLTTSLQSNALQSMLSDRTHEQKNIANHTIKKTYQERMMEKSISNIIKQVTKIK